MLQKLESGTCRCRYGRESGAGACGWPRLWWGRVLAGGAWYVYGGAPAQSTAQLATAPVVRGDLEQNVTALGTIKPKTYVDVGTQVSGQLRRVLVNIGDTVKKGDLLAQIDPTVYQTRVLGDQAQLGQSQGPARPAEGAA